MSNDYLRDFLERQAHMAIKNACEITMTRGYLRNLSIKLFICGMVAGAGFAMAIWSVIPY